MPKFKMH